ncbi:MAG: chemotaxis protein CheW [Planctomycetes bacterium]|nr:chemotaxis protein CheW [Planctomycetota bacterium]
MRITSFHIGDGLYGIPVLLAEEFFRPVPVTPVPLADPRVEGLIHVRGKTATVLDMRRCLDKPPRPQGQSSKMILLETESDLTQDARDLGIKSHDESVALRVDSTGRIITVPKDDIIPRPAHIEHEFVDGIVRVDEGYLILLCVRTLIDRIMAESCVEEPEM